MTLVVAVADVTARVSSWALDPRRSSLCHLQAGAAAAALAQARRPRAPCAPVPAAEVLVPLSGGLVLLGARTVVSWLHTRAQRWHLQGGGRRCLPQQLSGSVRSEQPGSSRRTTGHQGCGFWASRCSRGNRARWAMSRPWPSPDGYWGEVELGLPRQEDRGNYPGLRAHRRCQQPVSWGWSGLSFTGGTRLRGSVLCQGSHSQGSRVQGSDLGICAHQRQRLG